MHTAPIYIYEDNGGELMAYSSTQLERAACILFGRCSALLNMPFVAAFVVKQCGDARFKITVCLELKEEK